MAGVVGACKKEEARGDQGLLGLSVASTTSSFKIRSYFHRPEPEPNTLYK